LLSALALALSLALLEGVLSWTYAFVKTRERMKLRERPEQSHAQHDAELGWTNQPSRHIENLYGPGRHFTSNAQGARASEEYTRAVPARKRRIVFAGDSFTMGFGVGDEHTYPAQLERLDARLQGINLGMGAYGADQAFLRLRRDGAQFEKNAVVFAVIGHDLRRMERDYFMAPKPKLGLSDGGLVVTNVPVPERDAGEDARFAMREFFTWLDLGKALKRVAEAVTPVTDAPAERAAESTPEFAPLAEAMLGELAIDAKREGFALLVAYLPTRPELASGQAPARDWLLAAARARGIRTFDATPAFAGRGLAHLFREDGHYSEAGNALVARALLPVAQELCGLAPERASAPSGQSGSDSD
jgi:lysophospholipase L1-like esterase